MEWNERFATGIPHLDNQHRMLFRMESDFSQALSEGAGEGVYGEFLRSLELYSRMHFGAEEACMFRLHCTAATANIQGHEAFRRLLDEARATHAAQGYRRDDAIVLTERLREWLASHIGRIDTQLRPMVEGTTRHSG